MEIIRPEKSFFESYCKGCIEGWNKIHDNYIIHDPEQFESWKKTILQEYQDQENGVNLPEGYVPSITYWLVDNKQYIGTLKIRTRLSTQLRYYGGVYGYYIRPTQQRKGYGYFIAMEGLKKCREMGMKEIVQTCQARNIPSYNLLMKMPYKMVEKENILLYGIQQDIYRFYF